MWMAEKYFLAFPWSEELSFSVGAEICRGSGLIQELLKVFRGRLWRSNFSAFKETCKEMHQKWLRKYIILISLVVPDVTNLESR